MSSILRFLSFGQPCVTVGATAASGSRPVVGSQVPRRARSTRRLRAALVASGIGSGRAAAESAASIGVSRWLVQQVEFRGPDATDVDTPAAWMLGIDEHRYRSVRFLRDTATKALKRYEPWMTTIVDLDTGQVLEFVDGRHNTGIGEWLFACSLQWRRACR
ncbi:hypothetical protein [Arthrobacter sp. 18067]|uniref:hypothetical protein n=1 Tax=Arthrobacter sp. 18067 TaxID=2681413 RepID=UPI001358261F|nr:hypothetical protein [Arthrobacter sp. 18067]